ncbi:hypothetical protein NLJ89_g10985 [Agrocybe chaxingu]|uniref:Uncharacterized protein n=1 Tax=Agrocybe chaxingu TaxID=84603 RepID=A0A9W8JQS5_9AGAR|nr:hypothetical protein NLJ89_g10985 [Agrocybe chaxingu]
MSLDLSALSQHQILRFFRENASVTQPQCNEKAQQIIGQPVTPTACQGGTSYTVEGGELVVQFRAPNSPLDMVFLQSVEQAYPGFAPRHEHRGQFGQLHVYVMNNVGGVSMYLARTELQDNNYRLLRITIDDYARRVTPALPLPAPGPLCRGLAARAIPQRLFQNNLHVDKAMGRLVGVCGLEKRRGWSVWDVAGRARDHAWDIDHKGGGLLGVTTPTTRSSGSSSGPPSTPVWGVPSDTQKRRIEAARLIGLFLAHGFQNGHPATDSEDLGFLGAVVLN